MFFVGVFLLLVAFAVGVWRVDCRIAEMKFPENLPLHWHSAAMRIGTWILVAATTLLGAVAVATSVAPRGSWSELIIASLIIGFRIVGSGVVGAFISFRRLERLGIPFKR